MFMKEKLILDESLFIEMSSQDQELLEARNKKKSKRRKNKLSFKGFGWWPIYIDDEDHNCGNMEYNNNMFNKMMGGADSTTADISGGGGEGAIGMGESFIFTPKSEKLDISSTLKSFINEHQNLIDLGEWKELFITAHNNLSYQDQGVLVYILKDAGLVEVIKNDF